MADERYPIGKFQPRLSLSPDERRTMIDQLAATPQRMRDAVRGLDDAQLDTPYRDGGWTVRQVVHHVPDSHLKGYVRMKLALTEDAPIVKPYEENEWAKLRDTRDTPVATSLQLLEALHQRWDVLLRSLDASQFARKFKHPDYEGTVDLILALYAWHGRHHTAHVTSLRERMKW